MPVCMHLSGNVETFHCSLALSTNATFTCKHVRPFNNDYGPKTVVSVPEERSLNLVLTENGQLTKMRVGADVELCFFLSGFCIVKTGQCSGIL
jgi:hypothetical protein